MDVSRVRNQLTLAMERARKKAQERRAYLTTAEQAYAVFLQSVAIPLVRQLTMALKAETVPFTMSTPEAVVKLASDRNRDDFIQIGFDATADPPGVVIRVSTGRGSRVITEERPLKPGAAPEDITDEDVLNAILIPLERWLER